MNQIPPASKQEFSSRFLIAQPSGLAFDSQGSLYIADAVRGVIWQSVPAAAPPNATPTPWIGYNGIRSAAPNVPLIQPYGEPPLPPFAPPIAPGELLRIRGVCLGPFAPVTPPYDADGKLPVNAGGVQITANGIPVPLVSVSSGEILAIAPYELDGPSDAVWTLTYGGATASKFVSVQAAAPAMFVVLNQDGSVNSQANPATKGNQAAFFVTGLGQTDPPGIDGLIAQPPLPQSSLGVRLTIAGQDAEVLFAGPAPGFVGLSQVNVRVPPDVSGQGALRVNILAGSFAGTQTNLTIWIAP